MKLLADVAEPVVFWGLWLLLVIHYRWSGLLIGWLPAFLIDGAVMGVLWTLSGKNTGD